MELAHSVFNRYGHSIDQGLPAGLAVENPPAMQGMWVRPLGQEDPLEQQMATHFSILPEESHGQRSLGDFSPWGRRVRQD